MCVGVKFQELNCKHSLVDVAYSKGQTPPYAPFPVQSFSQPSRFDVLQDDDTGDRDYDSEEDTRGSGNRESPLQEAAAPGKQE